jgi:hypothetical protein
MHGVKAYAEKQAALSEHLAHSAATHWCPALAKKGISPEWAAEYVSLPLEDCATRVSNNESNEWEDEEEVDDDLEDDEQDHDPEADTDIIDFFEDDD